ncbi:putative vanillate O-demethylase oxidoreductase [Mollisia scopiformis]|uniref:Putative vanillate O-demethylase oxidoreductase n=1 Tax=Mollisia scopiformis TaxID=149040 RepID=A0A132B5Q9_MOLSC|nr:putative vanillate O-demethylase oxidoreductase [Mollisia scopiformis]KUJ07224.1 putative vanillate O-demethylase oxidoreductase [Mollisia scopiformis]
MGSWSEPNIQNALPQYIDTIEQVRTGKARPFHGLSTMSGIFKTPHSQPVKVNTIGLQGDERVHPPHQSPEKAVMQYASQHYPFWQKELPQSAPLFKKGGFGENIVTQHEYMSEENVCVGDIYRFGEEVVIQVSEPRAPCFKLNHRFQVKDMSKRSQDANKTGWYYRVLKEGYIKAGDEIVLLERPHPQWTMIQVQWYLYRERKNAEVMKELAYMKELGEETRDVFLGRLQKGVFREDNDRLIGGEENVLKWNPYRVISKRRETPRIYSFTFEAVTPHEPSTKVQPGSHVRVKLGEGSKLVRAYSVVGGDSNRFELGISLEEGSRGGSKYLHEKVKVGDILPFSEMKSDFPLEEDADNHILIAGGIGITAFITSAQAMKTRQLKYKLYYAVRSSEDVAFSSLLADLGDNVHIMDKSKGQRLNVSEILGKGDFRTHVYVCGPERLLDAVKAAATTLGFPQSNIHSEAFTASTSGDPFTVDLAKSEKTLDIKQEETLLDVLRDAGFDVGSSCEVGNCGTCRVGVKSGRVEHRGTGLLDDEKEGSMLSCVSRGIGRIVLDL